MSRYNYDRYPVYSARMEGRDIVRAGLQPYLDSVGLKMPPAVPVGCPTAEVTAVWEDNRAAITRAFNGVRHAFSNIAQSVEGALPGFRRLAQQAEAVRREEIAARLAAIQRTYPGYFPEQEGPQ